MILIAEPGGKRLGDFAVNGIILLNRILKRLGSVAWVHLAQHCANVLCLVNTFDLHKMQEVSLAR